ncbi:TetR/AcrR family transcriptional regulator [Acerihabitans sp. TG2]|uniref:TetR/AcrR family transcriptional regulator n=1 Tax=Acerihabitans sp. TG2 TaxID=3096008 RepID=UPI002B2346E9|nr:TetR/AcrR family transcriptional regulator [Acerihabitans sp. TG2]MEA9391566.1 TetR/AcrR family transcriptional regulator [Acerihabitans sp. TG2]
MRVKTETRRQAIIAVAGELFLQHGYAAVSMAAISAKLGGSRVTLYNYFATKEQLFEAYVIEAGSERSKAILNFHDQCVTDLRSRLFNLGKSYLALVLDSQVLAIHRMIIGEVGRFPELASIFYESGVKIILQQIQSILAAEIKPGRLRTSCPKTMALHFRALCEAGNVEWRLWGLREEINEQSSDQTLFTAIDAFLEIYADSPRDVG